MPHLRHLSNPLRFVENWPADFPRPEVKTDVLTFVFDEKKEKELEKLVEFVQTNFPDRKLDVVKDNKGKIAVSVTSTLPSEFPKDAALKHILSDVSRWPAEFPRPEVATGVKTFVFSEKDEWIDQIKEVLEKEIKGSVATLKKDSVGKSILDLTVTEVYEERNDNKDLLDEFAKVEAEHQKLHDELEAINSLSLENDRYVKVFDYYNVQLQLLEEAKKECGSSVADELLNKAINLMNINLSGTQVGYEEYLRFVVLNNIENQRLKDGRNQIENAELYELVESDHENVHKEYNAIRLRKKFSTERRLKNCNEVLRLLEEVKKVCSKPSANLILDEAIENIARARERIPMILEKYKRIEEIIDLEEKLLKDAAKIAEDIRQAKVMEAMPHM